MTKALDMSSNAKSAVNTEITSVAPTLAIARKGMFAETAACAILEHVHKTTSLELAPGAPLLVDGKTSGKKVVIFGSYYDQPKVEEFSKNNSVDVMGFAEDITNKYKAQSFALVPVDSAKSSYPAATWKQYCSHVGEPLTLGLVDSIARGKNREAAQYVYVEFGSNGKAAAQHMLFDAKFDQKSALDSGAKYAKKADSVLEFLIKGAGSYEITMTQPEVDKASIPEVKDKRQAGKFKLGVVNAASDIMALGHELLKKHDLALIARYSFDLSAYQYTLMCGNGLSAIFVTRDLWKYSAGGPHSGAGWNCQDDIQKLLTHIGASKVAK